MADGTVAMASVVGEILSTVVTVVDEVFIVVVTLAVSSIGSNEVVIQVESSVITDLVIGEEVVEDTLVVIVVALVVVAASEVDNRASLFVTVNLVPSSGTVVKCL